MNFYKLIKSLLGVFLLLLSGVSEASAQVERTSPALQLTEVGEQDGRYRYVYRVAGLGARGELISDVYIDVGTPGTAGPPRQVTTRGSFFFDAIRDFYSQLGFAHPLLFVGTPENWSGAIYRQGVLSWGAKRYMDGENFGVRRGGEVRGFEIHSNALPAFRKFKAVPYRKPGTLEATASLEGAAEGEVDRTWILHTGYVIAPGWNREELTGRFLNQQVKASCDMGMLENCGRYLRFVDQVLAAEARGSDKSFLAALRQMHQHLRTDDGVHKNARFILERAIAGLNSRPPSRREVTGT